MVSRTTRLSIVLGVSIAFFGVEIGVGFKTKSLALIADAFHYLNDVISYALALVATRLAKRAKGPPGYTYAFRRAEIVGAFFNATFLLALGVSIFLQAIERFVNLPEVDHPLWVLIVGCVGLALNIVCMLTVHEHGGHGHGAKAGPSGSNGDQLLVELNRIQVPGYGFARVDHSSHNHATPKDTPPAKSLGLAGVLMHLMGDAVNNVGVILAAAIMWRLSSAKRFYADPAASLAISLIIIGGAIPLSLKSSRVLLEAAPKDLDIKAVQEDLQTIPSVQEIHDLHIWHLTESDLLATFHCRTSVPDIKSWLDVERELKSCLGAYGITHVTISPELATMEDHGPAHDEMDCGVGSGSKT
ncbi:CDF zinc transporter [Kockovaella imperatae]|uniref:CDF zinc transporter n=1 Tax=Kockovaella imperatae TaxID=4999 RepID=A0A1Y1UCX4_9TREE|nr:CDF zinc transporter [Kockovaella imperatae]ORX35898.1 CDF zinc transporter [Kockovaella imperatae]